MNPAHPFPLDATAATAPVDSAASLRLSLNRERLAAWLAADRARRARPSLMGWAASAAWPLIQGLREHPSASLAAGALVQRLLRPAPAVAAAAPAVASAPVLRQGLALVRRHPKTSAAVVAASVGAAWFWSRSATPRSTPR